MYSTWQEFLLAQGALLEVGKLLNFPGDEIPENKIKDSDNIITDLSHLAIIEISGNDAEDFLHGQFTTNIKQLSKHHLQFSAWCNPKGQVKATFFIYLHGTEFYILLPDELKESIIKQLQMYILRADVKLTDKSDKLIRVGLQTHDATLLADLIESVPEQQGNVTHGQVTTNRGLHALLTVAPNNEEDASRYILIGSADRQITLWQELVKHFTPIGTPAWELLDIKAMYPWITTQTTQRFLPQMINLDLMDGLDYQKGCYPGQEIIARLHFRGLLKRSLYLATCTLESCSEIGPEIGDPLYGDDNEQSVGTVVNTQQSEDKYYLLAVIENDSVESKLSLRSSDGPGVNLQQLPSYEKE